MPSRRHFLFGLAGAGAASIAIAALPALAAQHLPAVTIYKSPSCGCCVKWAAHLRDHGFQTVLEDRDDLQTIKSARGVPTALQSCHTAIVGDYTIEGHVPARDIELLLTLAPQVLGLAVPDMPIGSPGMEMGAEKEPFASYLFTTNGYAVFAQH